MNSFTRIRPILGLLTIVLLLTITACNSTGNKPADTHDHSGHVHDYACPMHPEVDGHEGDKCSKCGMLLEKIQPKEEVKYTIQMNTHPAEVEAGKEFEIILKPTRMDNTTALVPLDEVHEKKIHLILVSDDLSQFQHIHPEYTEQGDYRIKTTVSQGGKYHIYADYKPSGSGAQLDHQTIEVKGDIGVAKNYTTPQLTATDSDITLELIGNGSNFKTNEMLHIDGRISMNGKSISANELDNFLGAKAHVVLIGVDNKSFIHVHPEISGNNLHMHATIQDPGTYRAWIQFMYRGKLYTTDYVLIVNAGNGTSQGDHHTHDAHSHHHE